MNMTAFEWIRFAIGALFVVSGMFVMVTAVVGNLKFKYVLSRMHAAGLGDTMGIFLIFAGVSILSGNAGLILKLLAVIVFLWLSSPVASHMIMKMEIDSGSTADGTEERK